MTPTTGRSHLADPSPEQLAAIVAAIEATWPRPVAVEDDGVHRSPWRFSGRWWSRPHTVQRSRPWVERRV